MVQYIQSQPSFLESMLGSGLQAYQKKKQQTNQAQALGQMLGLDDNKLKQFSAMSPESQKLYVENTTKNNAIDQKTRQAQNEQQQIIKLLGLGNPPDPLQQPDVGQGQPTEQGFNLGESMGMQQPEVTPQQQPIANQPQQQPPVSQPQQPPVSQPQQPEVTPPQQPEVTPQQQPEVTPPQQQKRYTQDEINKVALINPNSARIMQSQNEALDKEKQEDRKLTQQERAGTYKTNLPAYKEAQTSIRKYDTEKTSLDQLSKLNSSGKLPEKLSININPKTGDLIIPALANAEMQRYVKLINDFTTKAKDSYGAKVTNFELERFMMRLPTLSNSREGRAQILEQMDIINELNVLKERELKVIYDKHGLSNIDYQQANILAEQSVSGKESALIERMNNIGNSVTQTQQKTKNAVNMPSKKNGKTMDEATARKILKKAGGDPAKATELARNKDYDI